MECKPFSPEEAQELTELIQTRYEDSPLQDTMSQAEFDLICYLTRFALDEDLDDLVEMSVNLGATFQQAMDNPAFCFRFMRLLEAGAASGNGGCCCNLANLYHMGCSACPADYATARELYLKGRELGDMQSAVNLGYMYYYGRGGEPDLAAAYECYAVAAACAHHPEAYCKLGDLYAHGKFVSKNDPIAWTLYKRAYELAGDDPLYARPAHHMADYLMHGIEGVLEKDYDSALLLYSQAERGYYNLIYNEGLGYYKRQLAQAIEGQQKARQAIQDQLDVHID